MLNSEGMSKDDVLLNSDFVLSGDIMLSEVET